MAEGVLHCLQKCLNCPEVQSRFHGQKVFAMMPLQTWITL